MSDKHETIKTSKEVNIEEQKFDDLAKQSHSLKGTFVFVMFLGVFIILSWTAIYVIFITR